MMMAASALGQTDSPDGGPLTVCNDLQRGLIFSAIVTDPSLSSDCRLLGATSLQTGEPVSDDRICPCINNVDPTIARLLDCVTTNLTDTTLFGRYERCHAFPSPMPLPPPIPPRLPPPSTPSPAPPGPDYGELIGLPVGLSFGLLCALGAVAFVARRAYQGHVRRLRDPKYIEQRRRLLEERANLLGNFAGARFDVAKASAAAKAAADTEAASMRPFPEVMPAVEAIAPEARQAMGAIDNLLLNLVGEMYSSERVYHANLSTALLAYKQPLVAGAGLTARQEASLFANLEALQSLSLQMISEVRRWRLPPICSRPATTPERSPLPLSPLPRPPSTEPPRAPICAVRMSSFRRRASPWRYWRRRSSSSLPSSSVRAPPT